MALTYKKFFDVMLGTTHTSYYAVPSGHVGRLTEMVASNVGTAEQFLSVSIVPSGITQGNSNILIPDVQIPGRSVLPMAFSLVMNPGDFISAKANSAATTLLYASGLEIGSLGVVA